MKNHLHFSDKNTPVTETANRNSARGIFALPRRAWEFFRYCEHKTFSLLSNLATNYSRFQIRIKFSILITLILLVVIFVLSFSILEGEKFALKERVNEVCRLSVQNLSGVARDNLLLEVMVPIQELINSMMRMEIEGLKYAFVVNRQGVAVAHSDVQKIGRNFPQYIQEDLIEKNDRAIEKENYFEYIEPFYAIKQTGKEPLQKVLVGVAVVGFSRADIYRPIRKAKRFIYLITIAVIGLSAIGVYFVARGMSAKITRLSESVKNIRQGNLDVEVPVTSQDEIGILATEFNRMVRHLKENIQMQKFVSQLTVDMIRQTANSSVEPQRLERRNIAVLFSDIRNFTTLSEKLEPESLLEVVNVYLDLQTNIIEKHQGVVDKFVGDEVIAIFQGGRMVDDALKAAIEIQRGIKKLNQQRKHENMELLTVGISINYGPVMIGSMGSKKRMDYTAIGDTVNLGSHICNIARPGEIVITQNVIYALAGSYSVIKLDPFMLKGRSKPVQVYRISYF